ncbi:MAG: hypothetical protein AAGA77_23980 [Bacteroidota bacterium]
MSNPLPVLSILNNVRTISDFLYISQQTVLTSSIINSNPVLATDFVNWQQDIYNEYFEGFISENLIAQPYTIQGYYNDAFPVATMQSLANSTLIPTGSTTPGLIVSADSVSNLVTKGNIYASGLETIAKGIQGADQKKVDALMAIVDSLSTLFDQQEDELTKGSFGLGADIVVTAVNVAIAVGSEGETIQPLISSISKVGTDAITELNLSKDINNTIAELQQAWSDLDSASNELANITLIVNQLNAVIQKASATIKALKKIVNDWQKVANATMVSANKWLDTENTAFKEWTSRMVLVSFSTATQTIS